MAGSEFESRHGLVLHSTPLPLHHSVSSNRLTLCRLNIKTRNVHVVTKWSVRGTSCHDNATMTSISTIDVHIAAKSIKISVMPRNVTMCSICVVTELQNISYFHKRGPGSSVGIANEYGLDGSGIESRWGGGKIFRRPDRPWGPPSLLYNGYRVFPGSRKRTGRDADPSPPSSAEV